MSVPFYNFSRLHNDVFLQKIRDRFDQIILENSFIEGTYNYLFEREFAEISGAKHCLLVGNGTDALELALHAANIGPGDKVGVPGITFHASAEAVQTVGAEPVLIDIDLKTGLMCPISLKRVLKTVFLNAVMPVHIYGLPAPIEDIEAICLPKRIKIIEDGAQAHGAQLAKGPVGSSRNITTFSFYPTKNLGAFGDAGAIMTGCDATSEKLKSLRNHGRSLEGIQFFGRNSRCDHLQAAVLHLKLESFKEQLEFRRKVASLYFEGIKNPHVSLLDKKYLNISSWHLFPIFLSSKEVKLSLRQYLLDLGVASALFYEKSLGEELPLLNSLGERKNALLFAERVLCLPIYPHMTDAEIELVIASTNKFEWDHLNLDEYIDTDS